MKVIINDEISKLRLRSQTSLREEDNRRSQRKLTFNSTAKNNIFISPQPHHVTHISSPFSSQLIAVAADLEE